MHEIPILRDLVILIAVAIPVVLIAHRLKVPPVVGFLLTGMAIGPYGLALIGRSDSVTGLAEVGVVLLLFAIGLELSLSRIIRLGRVVAQGGGLQVGGTIAVVAVAWVLLGRSLNAGILFGALMALSSTAIVLKVYTDRGELDTPHGRVVIAILLFQDLCVVPLMLVVPFLAGAGSATGALRDLGVSLVLVTVLVMGGRAAVPWILERVVGLRNRELFTLCIVFLGVGAAYLTSRFGLSLALGAFIAGLVISESEYGVQALSDILPFRDTFSGIFFTSVGMLLDLHFVAAHLLAIVGMTLGVIALKSAIGMLATRSLGRSLDVSVTSGLALAQVGEFSFVLAGAAATLGLLTEHSYQLFLGMSVVSMIAAPFVIARASTVSTLLHRLTGRPSLVASAEELHGLEALNDHVIIVGYGLNGQNLARVLKASGIRYVVLEQNGQVVRRARLAREPVLFGDGSGVEVLERVGIARARVIVFAISAPAEERRGVVAARQASGAVRIIVRTRYVAAMEELERLGADEVIPEEFETSIEIFARVLRLYGVASNTIQHEVDTVRQEHYGTLRGLAVPELKLDALKHLGVHGALDTIEVEPGAEAVGCTVTELNLRQRTGATIIAVVRDGVARYTPDPAFRFQAGDTVVLVGEADALRSGTEVFVTQHG